MIKIQERIPRKLSGKTSLFVTSDVFNIQLVNILKTYVPAVFNKKDNSWEIALTYLDKLLDDLCKLDTITLELFQEKERNQGDFNLPPLTEDEIRAFRIKPYDHQIEAINFLLSHPKSLLLDAPGLGKTTELIYTAETLKRRGLVKHCVIITGVASLRQNWKKEIQKFSHESCVILGERINRNGRIVYAPVKERAKQLKEKIDEFFIIFNVESLRDEQIIEAFTNSTNQIDMICFDEIHRGVANKQSQSASGLLKLDAKFKYGATGSLIVNSPISAYVSLYWTNNDHATLTNFKNQYCEFGSNAFTKYQIVGYKNLDLLKEELDSCSIRRTKNDIKGLPPKVVNLELVEMDEANSKFYEAVKQGVKDEAMKVELNASNLLALTTRLRQATADPGILTTENIVSSKMIRCIEHVEDLVEQGEKVVVMSTFKPPIYKLAKMLEKYQPLICTGDQADSEVSENITKFQNDPNSKILLGSTAKCATGLTLNAASYMICLDIAWTDAMNQQCFDRIHRANNTRSAFITVLATKNTIDERVWSVAQRKKDLSDFIIDDIQNSVSNSLKDEMANIIKNL